GGLLLVYSAGAALGPIIAAPVMEALGPGSLFLFISATRATLSLVIGLRLVAGGEVLVLYRGRYAPSPRTTQSYYELEGAWTEGDGTEGDGTEEGADALKAPGATPPP
ncbi:MAG: hypothetical protein AAF568_11585, partial [Pseudomonadota bacterium]